MPDDEVHVPELPGTRTLKKDVVMNIETDPDTGVSLTVPKKHMGNIGAKPTPQPSKSNTHGEHFFDVENALDDAGTLGGTIITDKKDEHTEVQSVIKEAWNEWWGHTRTSLTSALVLFAPEEKPVVEAPETRKEIIKEAARLAPHVPQDDHRMVIEKMKVHAREENTTPERAPRIMNEHARSHTWTHRTPEMQQKEAPYESTETVTFHTPIQSPEITPQISTNTPKTVPSFVRPLTSSPLTTKEDRTPPTHRAPSEVIEERKTDSVDFSFFPHHHRERGDAESDDTDENEDVRPHSVASSFLKPLTVTLPDAPVTIREPEEILIPHDHVEQGPVESAPTLDITPTPEQPLASLEHDAYMQGEIPTLSPTPHIETPLPEYTEHETLAMSAEEVEEILDDPLTPPQPPLRKINEEIQHEREEYTKEPHAIEESDLSPLITTSTPVTQTDEQLPVTPLHVEAAHLHLSSPDKPTHAVRVRTFQLIALLGIIVLGIIGGVSTARIFGPTLFTHNPSSSLSDGATPVPAYVKTAEQVPIRLPETREQFLATLTEKIKNMGSESTQFVFTNEGGAGTDTTTLFNTFTTRAPESFLRTIDAYAMFGAVRTTSTPTPFIILRTRNFDTAFAGMLAWEPYISADLTPLFGPSVSRTRFPQHTSNGVTEKPQFTDALSGNRSIRILYDEEGIERIVYAFLNKGNLLIITTSTEALGSLIQMVP